MVILDLEITEGILLYSFWVIIKIYNVLHRQRPSYTKATASKIYSIRLLDLTVSLVLNGVL